MKIRAETNKRNSCVINFKYIIWVKLFWYFLKKKIFPRKVKKKTFKDSCQISQQYQDPFQTYLDPLCFHFPV